MTARRAAIAARTADVDPRTIVLPELPLDDTGTPRALAIGCCVEVWASLESLATARHPLELAPYRSARERYRAALTAWRQVTGRTVVIRRVRRPVAWSVYESGQFRCNSHRRSELSELRREAGQLAGLARFTNPSPTKENR